MSILISLEAFRVGEGDEGHDGRVAEIIEAIAHGARMNHTGQSENVTVEDKHHGLVAMILETPRFAIGIKQFDAWCRVADFGTREW